MSFQIHQLLILKGSKVQIYCKDGLSSLDVYNIQHIFRLGGNIKFVNCGAANQYAAYSQAGFDMQDKWWETPDKDSKIKSDY